MGSDSELNELGTEFVIVAIQSDNTTSSNSYLLEIFTNIA